VKPVEPTFIANVMIKISGCKKIKDHFEKAPLQCSGDYKT
jgi:hypothetical protein